MSELDSAVERLVVELGAAFQQRAVYAAGHPQVRRGIERAVRAHGELLAQSGLADSTLLVVEGALVIDRRPLPEEATWARGLLHGLKRAQITGLTLAQGLDTVELEQFLERALVEIPPSSSRRIQVGRAGFAGSPESVASAPSAAPAPRALLSSEELAEAREELLAAATGAARADRLRGVVGTLVRALSGARLAPLRMASSTVEERALVHGLATSLATLRLGRALGLEGERLEELGLAGLLHDTGRLPSAGAQGADSLRLHPVVGAARLAATEGLPDVVAVVAFEHHLRFDSAPNYPLLPERRPPSAAAQIVAVADSWDTLRDRTGAGEREAIALLRQRAGTFLNPDLVDLFAALMAAAPAAGGAAPGP